MSLASLDGHVGPAGEARISVTDEGLLRGDGAFEVMRLYSGRPFALQDHLDRLRHSARACAWRPTSTPSTPNSPRCWRRTAPPTASCASS